MHIQKGGELRSNHKLILRTHVDRHVNARCEPMESLVTTSPRMAPKARYEQAHGLHQEIKGSGSCLL